MSAVALARSADGNQVVLAGDGMNTKDGEIHSLNSSKIIKFNDSIGSLWMGIGKSAIGKYVAKEAKRMNAVKDVADCVSEWMHTAYDTKGHRHLLDDCLYWFLILGYDDTGFNAYRIWNGSEKLLEPELMKFKPGDLGAKTERRGPDKTNFQKLVATKYWPLYRPHLEHAVKEAFTEMVNTYKDEGELCGGELFFETIQNPHN